ncbi:hypothetical protein BGZ60DRAFT_421902 [Tricladium varicosporioides]|nr:hypothetical protein BGZ60DRAFT_421902 [Hymenoscyphus varicosporioides]
MGHDFADPTGPNATSINLALVFDSYRKKISSDPGARKIQVLNSGDAKLQPRSPRISVLSRFNMRQPISKIYSNPPSPLRPVTEKTKFSFHLAVFRSLRTRKPMFLNESYTTGSVPRSLSYSSVGSPMANMITLLCNQTSSFGEQSIWKTTDEKSNEIIIFIEVLEEGDTVMSSRYERFKTLVNQYAGDVSKDVSLDVCQEIRDYACVVFFNHWIKQDLENVADPRLGVHTPGARAAVARAFGLGACTALADFLDILEES